MLCPYVSRHDSLSLLSRKPSCLAVEVKASFMQGVRWGGVEAFRLERALNSERAFPRFPAHTFVMKGGRGWNDRLPRDHLLLSV